MPGAHNVNSAVLEACPDIVERLNARGDEYVGHGRTNSERQDVLWEEDEARLIAECTEMVTRLSGRRPEGWLGPGSPQSGVTLDLLKEAGYRYVMDWALDDQPIWMRTRAGPILSVPYPIELNDLPALVYPPPYRPPIRRDDRRPVRRDARAIAQISAGLRGLGAPVHHRPAVPAARVPRRASATSCEHRDELWITTPGEIARYCESLPKGTIPGSG